MLKQKWKVIKVASANPTEGDMVIVSPKFRAGIEVELIIFRLPTFLNFLEILQKAFCNPNFDLVYANCNIEYNH
jgi:hypothetical protein